MKMNSQKIALSAMGGALSTVFLLLSIYVPPMQASFLIFSSVAIMLPLHKDCYVGGILAYIISSGLALLTGQIAAIIGYITVFGIYPVLNRLLSKKLLKNKQIYKYVISYIIKVLYINIAFTITYFVLKAVAPDLLQIKVAIPVLFILGNVVFIVYDFIMLYMQKLLDLVLIKYVMSKGIKTEEKQEVKEDPFEEFSEEKQEDTFNSILEEDNNASEKIDLGNEVENKDE